MAKSWAVGFYHSARWAQARREAWIRDKGLCIECLKRGRIVPAEIVHHKVPLTPTNISNPAIATDLGNLECVCRECHSRLHGFTTSCTRQGLAFDAYGNLVEVGDDAPTLRLDDSY